MPYTTLVPGTTITASWANASVRDQGVVPFASAAARTSAVAAPIEGMFGYRIDGKCYDGYDGTSYVRAGSFEVQEWKTADETVNTSSVLQNDDDLAWAVAANAVYAFSLALQYTTNSTANIKFAFTYPSGLTAKFGVVGYDIAGTLVSNGNLAESITYTSQGSGTDRFYVFTGTVTVSSTAGTLQLQWAQNTSNGSNTTVRAGSRGTLTRLS